MAKPKTFRTLVGGTLKRTQYVDGSDHLHIHFLEMGKTEICCHGCHSSVIYLHPRKSPSGMKELLQKHVKKHERCMLDGVDFDEWCPDIRLSLEVVDLSRPLETARDTHRNQ